MAITPGRYSFIGGTVLANVGQFVLVRSNMSSDFTNDEYESCTEAVSEGKAVCVQWKSGSAGMQAQLASMMNDGSLLFSFAVVNLLMVFIVSGSEPHDITAHTYSLGSGSSYTANLPIKIESGTITNNGTNLTCTGDNAWAEGKSNKATGHYSHAEGQLCNAKGQASHAGGQSCETSGQNSFAHGAYLKTSNQSSCQAAFGMYNSDQKAMFVIGNGTAENNRKDAFKVDQSGHLWCMVNGTLTDVSALLASL